VAASVDSAAGVPVAEPTAPHCAQPAGGASFTLGEPSANADEGSELQPFAAEMGNGVSVGAGFAVTLLRGHQDGPHGELVVLSATGAGKVLDLGRVGAVAPPPLVAGGSSELFVALAVSDAGGVGVRLGHIAGPLDAATLQWGKSSTLQWGGDAAWDFAINGSGGLLALSEGEGAGVRLYSVDVKSLSTPSAATRTLSGAELPRLVARPGGYWLVWVQTSKEGLSAKPNGASEDSPYVDWTPGRLRVSLLDGAGVAQGEPIAVMSTAARVVGYDVAALGSDGLLLTWREADSNPGSEGGKVRLARLSAGGGITPLDVPDEASESGVPALLVDAAQPRGWMALGGEGDDCALLALGPGGQPLGKVHGEPALGHGTAMALLGQQVLLARPEGRAVSFERVTCGEQPLPPVVEPAMPPSDAGATTEEESP